MMSRLVLIAAIALGCGGAKKVEKPKVEAPVEEPEIELTDEEILIRRKVLFELGSAEIFPNSFPLLTRVAELMIQHPELQVVEVQGHTDSTGSERINRKLSLARAKAVRSFLIERGVEAERLTAEGYGSTVPIADNETLEGRELNRRVQFKILQRAQ